MVSWCVTLQKAPQADTPVHSFLSSLVGNFKVGTFPCMVDPDLATILLLLIIVVSLLLMPPGPGTPLRSPVR
jgi:hypothetical protein